MLRKSLTLCTAMALTACAPAVYKDTVYVPVKVSQEIKTVSIDVAWPEGSPDFHGYARSRGEAAGEAAGSVASEGTEAAIESLVNDCSGGDCILIPVILPFAMAFGAIGNAALSDSAEEVKAAEAKITGRLADAQLPEVAQTALVRAVRARTPYQIVPSGQGDAALTVDVHPLEVSGARHERQNVTVNFVIDAKFDRLDADGAAQTLHSRLYYEPYGTNRRTEGPSLRLSKLASEIDEVVNWLPQAIEVLSSQVAEDIYSGFEVDAARFVIDQPNTDLQCILSDCKPAQVTTLQPILSWSPITAEDLSFGPQDHLTYSVRIVAFPDPPKFNFNNLTSIGLAEAAMDRAPVYEAHQISGVQHQVTEPLKACMSYLWQVRASLSDGTQARVSDWQGYFVERDGGGNIRRRMPWFMTPC
ncbi:MAG: hypothetical protein EP347_07390 [Alphaproteobacteria bacterium]|nr:MAG: hypothetical protein EP347_07390 [Alphaproteobacteria bacterium]